MSLVSWYTTSGDVLVVEAFAHPDVFAHLLVGPSAVTTVLPWKLSVRAPGASDSSRMALPGHVYESVSTSTAHSDEHPSPSSVLPSSHSSPPSMIPLPQAAGVSVAFSV